MSHKSSLNDGHRYAKQSQRARRDFIIHATIFTFINGLFFVVWLLGSMNDGALNFPWFIVLLLWWGIILLIHYMIYRRAISPKADVPPREHESLYEIPAIRMTEEEELTDSFIVELKKIKKYRDELTESDTQE